MHLDPLPATLFGTVATRASVTLRPQDRTRTLFLLPSSPSPPLWILGPFYGKEGD
jgi:hypothetical protein